MPNKANNLCNRANFDLACAMLTYAHPYNVFKVENIWMDYGAGMRWDTIICYRNKEGWGNYQVLCPRDWDLLNEATTALEVLTVVNTILEDQKKTLKGDR